MPDSRMYKAGEIVKATLTLEPGNAIPTGVWLYLNLQPELGGRPTLPPPNRVAFLTLQTPMSPLTGSVPTSEAITTLQLQAVVPKHIVGGVYKPATVIFFMPDGSQRQVAEADPDGDFVRHIADDPPTAFDTPVIKDLD